MIDRMGRDMIAKQIEANDKHDSYKSKIAIMEEETEKNRSAK